MASGLTPFASFSHEGRQSPAIEEYSAPGQFATDARHISAYSRVTYTLRSGAPEQPDPADCMSWVTSEAWNEGQDGYLYDPINQDVSPALPAGDSVANFAQYVPDVVPYIDDICWPTLTYDDRGPISTQVTDQQFAGFYCIPWNCDYYDSGTLTWTQRWANTVTCMKSRFISNTPFDGWIASADIFAIKANGTIGWDSWPAASCSGYTLGNVTYIKSVQIEISAAVFGDDGAYGFIWDGNENWNVVDQVSDTTYNDTMANACVGKINFLVYKETPTEWETRTGITISGHP